MTGHWSRHERVMWRRVGPSVLFLAPGSAELRLLTGSSAAMWQALETSATADELTQRLARAYDVAAEVIHDDVRAGLAELVQAGAVREGL